MFRSPRGQMAAHILLPTPYHISIHTGRGTRLSFSKFWKEAAGLLYLVNTGRSPGASPSRAMSPMLHTRTRGTLGWAASLGLSQAGSVSSEYPQSGLCSTDAVAVKDEADVLISFPPSSGPTDSQQALHRLQLPTVPSLSPDCKPHCAQGPMLLLLPCLHG